MSDKQENEVMDKSFVRLSREHPNGVYVKRVRTTKEAMTDDAIKLWCDSRGAFYANALQYVTSTLTGSSWGSQLGRLLSSKQGKGNEHVACHIDMSNTQQTDSYSTTGVDPSDSETELMYESDSCNETESVDDQTQVEVDDDYDDRL